MSAAPQAADRLLAVWWACTAVMVVGLLLQHRWPLPALALTSLGAAAHALTRDPQAARLEVLTAREREVPTLIARGRSNTESTEDLRLAPGTLRTHIGRIFAKLGLRDRVQAVILGYECGLVRRGDPPGS
jgi:DNA-binding NarL/FixJ family response regulator